MIKPSCVLTFGHQVCKACHIPLPPLYPTPSPQPQACQVLYIAPFSFTFSDWREGQKGKTTVELYIL